MPTNDRSKETTAGLLPAFSVIDVSLSRLSMERKELFTREGRNLGYNFGLEGIKFKQEGVRLFYDFDYHLSAFTFTNENQGDAIDFFQLKFSYEVEVATKEEPSVLHSAKNKQNIEIVLSVNLFPYVRELVTSLTSKMGLPPLVMPASVSSFGNLGSPAAENTK